MKYVWLLALLGLGACEAVPQRRTVMTPRAPAPIGPYSQAIRVGDTLFSSGQIGLDVAQSALVAGGIREETRQALDNLAAVLAEAGFEMSDVVSTTVHLVDLAEFDAMNEVYASRFGVSPPARTTVEVVALPKGARVEITAVALRSR